ncbi:cohesin domain-containing protein [Halococcoides cellulosivorans]|uniref:Cohesin domain-containing protein n=1 Tax=Halococcoides cellulosivorans TaxID=1679096 RepID=A0A2R4X2Z7_9EURY|nr:cohesin domain-containing protein [Halococcoides cellulosivorans]AWB28181.1 hypothetical protein HARCEL1_10920 [Halococcoides cellulosivorans]
MSRRSIAVTLVVVAVLAPSVAGAQTAVSVGNATGAPGETVTVPVAITDATVASYQVRIEYNASVLAVESVSGVDLGDPVVAGDDGVLQVTQTRSDGVTDPVVARVTFEVIGPSETPSTLWIAPSATKAFAPNGTELSITEYRHGQVRVGSAAPTSQAVASSTATAATTTPSAGPSEKASGSPVLWIVGALVGGVLLGALVVLAIGRWT